MIKVELKSGIYSSNSPIFKIKHNMGRVLLGADNKIIEMNTVTAHKLGFSLIKKSNEALQQDYISLSINGEEMGILPIQAKQLGAGILKKAIAADDYQTSESKK
jgi:hypothetical protein